MSHDRYLLPEQIEHEDNSKPLFDDTVQKGGYKVVATIVDRNNIPILKRQKYNLVCIDGVIKQYTGGDNADINWVNNDNWIPFVGDGNNYASDQDELKALLSSSTQKFIEITKQFTVSGILEIGNVGSIVTGVIVEFANNLEIKNTAGENANVIWDCNVFGSTIDLNYSTDTYLLDFFINNTTGVITWNNTGSGSLNARICNYSKTSANTAGTGTPTIVLGDNNYWIPKNKVNDLADVDVGTVTVTPNNGDVFLLRDYGSNIFRIITWSNTIDKIINYVNTEFSTTSQTIKGAINEIKALITSQSAVVSMGTATEIDWSLGAFYTNTISGAWTATDTGRIIGKTILIYPSCTGFTPPLGWVEQSGSQTFDSTSKILATCIESGVVMFGYINDL